MGVLTGLQGYQVRLLTGRAAGGCGSHLAFPFCCCCVFHLILFMSYSFQRGILCLCVHVMFSCVFSFVCACLFVVLQLRLVYVLS